VRVARLVFFLSVVVGCWLWLEESGRLMVVLHGFAGFDRDF
jgi:hypothetical protein